MKKDARNCKWQRMKRKHEGNITRHIKFTKSEAPPNEMLMQKVRARVEQLRINNEMSKTSVVQHIHQIAGDTNRLPSQRKFEQGEDKATWPCNEPPKKVGRNEIVMGLLKRIEDQKAIKEGKYKLSHERLHENLKNSARTRLTRSGVQGDGGERQSKGVNTSCTPNKTKNKEQQAIARLLVAKR